MMMGMVREGIREVEGIGMDIPNPTNGEDDVMIY